MSFNLFLGPCSAYSVKLSLHMAYRSISVASLTLEMIVTVENCIIFFFSFHRVLYQHSKLKREYEIY